MCSQYVQRVHLLKVTPRSKNTSHLTNINLNNEINSWAIRDRLNLEGNCLNTISQNKLLLVLKKISILLLPFLTLTTNSYLQTSKTSVLLTTISPSVVWTIIHPKIFSNTCHLISPMTSISLILIVAKDKWI